MKVRPVHWHDERDRADGWPREDPPTGVCHHLATYAWALARACLSPGVQVVLSRATAWPGHGVSNGARAPLALDVVELMLPSGAIVVPAERMPSPAARAAAFAWQTDRLLVAPALFGHEVLAVGLAAVPDGVRVDQASVEGAGERLAAALVAWDLGLSRRLSVL